MTVVSPPALLEELSPFGWQAFTTFTEDDVLHAWRFPRAPHAVESGERPPSFEEISQRLLTVMNTWYSLYGAVMEIGYAHVTTHEAAAVAIFRHGKRMSRFEYRLHHWDECIVHREVCGQPTLQEPELFNLTARGLGYEPYRYQLVQDEDGIQLYRRALL
ncbi:hypothetical protein, partial [Deinococcus ruber]|uniref:hypothetical protein n=1 Tax=Deinococcus ruber TaxID=1848197 RepID=UPI00166CC657